ncbi:MAG TPA: propionate/acetate kinase, partial [Acidimicrobiales bacterium]|nr:propionate/acetate kinase [Acidimicrobiales bacterium]
MRVLVVNAGSSTLKLSLVGPDDSVAAETEVEAERSSFGVDALRDFVAGLDGVDAVGHRVVHGGSRFTRPTVVDGTVVDAVAALTPLAPLHQPGAVAGLRAVAELLPDVPAVACFDTAFHAGLEAAAATYALPLEWRERWGLRRFGFHGLSHAWAVTRAAELLGGAGDPHLRVVSCHLGAGSSLCAAVGGRSVDTTMGFTPAEGLVMATRSGSVDPGLVTWLVTDAGLDARAVSRALARESGLAGLAGGSGDMREVLARADGGDTAAGLARDVWLHRLCREVGAMAASCRGLDALVFTGGIGQHQAGLRAAAADALGFLGV